MIDFGRVIETRGQTMRVMRDSHVVGTYKALKNNEKETQKSYFGFCDFADVQVGDWIIDIRNSRFFVYDIQPQIIEDTVLQIKCFVYSESEYGRINQDSKTTHYNIGTVYGSAIGDHASTTISVQNVNFSELYEKAHNEQGPDREQIEEVIRLLEDLVSEKKPIRKGIFARFSETMERYSWLSSAVASAILGWLVNL